MPHQGQLEVGKALFYGDKKEILLECGRKWGKTDVLCYSLYRWALTNPGTFNYYFAPFKDQIKDLVWANGRLPNFLPDHLHKKYIESINNTEMRIVFKNGSYIRCDGSDNYEKSRGYSATGLTVYDEAKDFHLAFHDAFDPNRAITNAPLLAVGTPGFGDDLLSKMWDQANTSKTGSAHRMPSSMNPHISADFLQRKKEEHIARDEYDVYLQEYEAQRIKLGTKFVFPMLNRKDHIRPHKELLDYVHAHRKDFDYHIGYDPGSAKCFAVGLFAIHRFNKHIIQMDEIYVVKLGKNSVRQIIPAALEKASEINKVGDDWSDVYDYAAAWFASEVQFEYPDYPHALFPCTKDLKNKEAKLSLMKDILLNGLFTFSDRCIKSYWEWENYKLDSNGKITKENDHCFVGDTLISTINGRKKIKDISQGEWVLTGNNYRKVMMKFDNGEKTISRLIISNGIELHLTEDHKIYTVNRGFIEAKDLTGEDVLCMESVSRLSLVGLYLSAGLSLIKLALGITLDASREKTGLSTFIGKYGNPLTEKYQLALKFIIKTGTPSIIQLKTLILSLKKIMRMNIEKRDQLGLALKNIWQHLKESGPSLKSGMLPKKEESGTPSTLLKILKKRNILPINASNVNRTSRVGPFKKTKSYFVQIIASHGGEDCLVSTMKLEAALLVVRILSVIDTQEKKTVHAIVLKRNIGKTKVYDLMVADRHEYRANGLLVHNCLDLTRYVLNLANYYTIEDAKPIDFKVKYEKGTFEQDEYRQRPEEGYGSFDLD